MAPLRRTFSSTQVIPQQSPVAGNLRLNTTSSSPLKRSHSQAFHLSMEETTHSTALPADEQDKLDSDKAREPSPVPTEIIEVEQDIDFIQECKDAGIAVHDYIDESAGLAAPSVWTGALSALALHDTHIRRPENKSYQVDGMSLYRLREIGWVTDAEADLYWREVDWERLNKYRNRPGGPAPFTVVPKRNLPFRVLRNAIRQEMFPSKAGDTPDEKIWQPEDTVDNWDGEGDYTLPRHKRQEVTETIWKAFPSLAEDNHVDKKRRCTQEEDAGDTDYETAQETPLNSPRGSPRRSHTKTSSKTTTPTRSPTSRPTSLSQPTPSPSRPHSSRRRAGASQPLRRTERLTSIPQGRRLMRSETMLRL